MTIYIMFLHLNGTSFPCLNSAEELIFPSAAFTYCTQKVSLKYPGDFLMVYVLIKLLFDCDIIANIDLIEVLQIIVYVLK
jgi:hypothetical protein